MKITPQTQAGSLRLGMTLLVGGPPSAAQAQSTNALTVVPMAQEQMHHFYKLPLAHTIPKFILGKLNHVYYYKSRQISFSRSAGFNDYASAPSQAEVGFVPSPLRVEGVSFIIDNERDNSLLIAATPEGGQPNSYRRLSGNG